VIANHVLISIFELHSKKCWVQPKFESNMDEPSLWVTFLNYVFNHTFGFLTQNLVKPTQHFLECGLKSI